MEHRQTCSYPIIPLSYAYGCSCHTSHAHNNCLKTITKCPTCRKQVTKPNLKVETWVTRPLNWIWKNPTTYKRGVKTIYIGVLIIFALNLAHKHEHIKLHPYVIGFSCVWLIFAHGVLFVDDCINKNWLYDEKTKRYY
jgi:hypothetical protein